MSREDTYFQFPIGLLYAKKSILEVGDVEKRSIIQNVIRFCLLDYAIKHEEDVDFETMAEEVNNRSLPNSLVLIHWAGMRLGVLPQSSYEDYRKALQSGRTLHYGKTLVRIKRDFLFEAEASWDWREFAMLCGVYAGIGDQPFSRLTQKRICTLAHGLSSQDECKRQKLEFKLTDRQIGYTIAELERRNFLCRASLNYRDFFYSHRISAGELDAELAKQARPPKVNHRQRTAELRKKAEFMATAKQARRDLGSDRERDAAKTKNTKAPQSTESKAEQSVIAEVEKLRASQTDKTQGKKAAR